MILDIAVSVRQQHQFRSQPRTGLYGVIVHPCGQRLADLNGHSSGWHPRGCVVLVPIVQPGRVEQQMLLPAGEHLPGIRKRKRIPGDLDVPT